MALTKVRGSGLDGSTALKGQEVILDADGDTSIQVSTDDVMVFDTGGSERMRIDSSANLLIGHTSQDVPVDDGGAGVTLRPSGVMLIGGTGTSIFANREDSNGEVVQFRRDGTASGRIGSSETVITIIGAEGDAGIAFQNNTYGDMIYPASNTSSGAKDNVMDIGYASGRFDDIYATNSSIQTSDENEKQDIASATTKELNVAKKLSALFKTFRWKDKVAEKGDKARTHNGIVAQEVQQAFDSEGLDASKYGLFTQTSWWEEKDDSTIHYKTEQEYKDKGSPKTAVKKTRLGVRYPELFSFIFSSIEARLTALENA